MAADPLLAAFQTLQKAEQLRQQHDFAKARSICESLVNQYPDYAAALHTLGLIFADQGRYDEALDCLVRAVMLNPKSWMSLTALSGVYLRLGAVDLAMTTLESAKSIKPRDASVLLTAGDIYRELREYELARDAYDRALAAEPGFAAAAIGLGWCHQNLGADREAAAVFEGLVNSGLRLLEPLRALANLPPADVTVDLLTALDRVVRDPSEDKLDFENSIPFVKAAALDRAGSHAEAWSELAAANRRVFSGLQKGLPQLSAMQSASLASLRGHPGRSGRYNDGQHPVSLFILGPSGCGKTVAERLVSALPDVKRGYENPIVENAVRRTFQSANLLTVSAIEPLPLQLEQAFRDSYFADLGRRAGLARVFTNTLSASIHGVERLASVLKNVRFVLIKRNLEDNLLRVFMRKYRPGTVSYAYDLKTARDHILWYHQMIDVMVEKFPDIVRVINYEDLVRDPAPALRTVAELCGLPPPAEPVAKLAGDVGCAAPYRNFIAQELARK